MPNPVWDAPKGPHPSCLRVLTLCWLALPRRRRSACVNIGVIQVQGTAGWVGLSGWASPPSDITLGLDHGQGWVEGEEGTFILAGGPAHKAHLPESPTWLGHRCRDLHWWKMATRRRPSLSSALWTDTAGPHRCTCRQSRQAPKMKDCIEFQRIYSEENPHPVTIMQPVRISEKGATAGKVSAEEQVAQKRSKSHLDTRPSG